MAGLQTQGIPRVCSVKFVGTSNILEITKAAGPTKYTHSSSGGAKDGSVCGNPALPGT